MMKPCTPVMRLLAPSFCLLLLAIFCKLFAFLYSHWWKPRLITVFMHRQGFTGPPPRFLSGNLHERHRLRKEATLHDMHSLSHHIVPRLMPDYVKWSQIYGKSFLFWWGTEPRLAVSDLEQIKELLSSKHVQALGRSKLQREGVTDFIGKGLLMANGHAWTHQRRVVAPAFHFEKLKHQVGHMVKCIMEVVEMWEKLLIQGEGKLELEVSEHMSHLAGDIIARTEFSSSYEKGKLIFSQLNKLQKLCTQSTHKTYSDRLRIRELKDEVEASFLEIIEARRAAILTSPLRRGNIHEQKLQAHDIYGQDLLGLMLEEMEAAKQEAAQQKNGALKGLYTSRQLMDECKTFFFTGHETTSLLLTWTIMLLGSNPSWQDRARQETLHLMRSTKGGLRLPDFEMLSKLKVLGMILLESLRLYTPATLLAREAFEDIKVGEVNIPKGLSVWVPVLAIHHDKSIWGEDADQFKPERFREGVAGACKNPMAFMPFSFGPRNCVGQNFALMECKLVLSILLSRFIFHLSPNYRHAPVFVLTLQPKHGVPIILQRITSSLDSSTTPT